MKKLKLKPAFTLIELLIVIAIIGILSTLAISNYSAIRASIENQFTVDTLIQEIRQQSKLSQNQQDPKCHNIYFQVEENQIQKYQTSFDSSTRTCQLRDAGSENLLEDSELIIDQIILNGNQIEEYLLEFQPPLGRPAATLDDREVQIHLQPDGQPENKKIILINLQNGSIQER